MNENKVNANDNATQTPAETLTEKLMNELGIDTEAIVAALKEDERTWSNLLLSLAKDLEVVARDTLELKLTFDLLRKDGKDEKSIYEIAASRPNVVESNVFLFPEELIADMLAFTVSTPAKDEDEYQSFITFLLATAENALHTKERKEEKQDVSDEDVAEAVKAGHVELMTLDLIEGREATGEHLPPFPCIEIRDGIGIVAVATTEAFDEPVSEKAFELAGTSLNELISKHEEERFNPNNVFVKQLGDAPDAVPRALGVLSTLEEGNYASEFLDAFELSMIDGSSASALLLNPDARAYIAKTFGKCGIEIVTKKNLAVIVVWNEENFIAHTKSDNLETRMLAEITRSQFPVTRLTADGELVHSNNLNNLAGETTEA